MRTCLVIDGDSGAGLSFARSLGGAGWVVLAARGTRAAASRAVAHTVDLGDPLHDPAGFSSDLARVVSDSEVPVDLVVPTTDLSWELAHTALRDTSTAVVGGDPATALPLLDKVHTLRRSTEAGFPVPAWIEPETAAGVVDAAIELGFPCVVKPRRSFQQVDGVLKQLRHTVVRDRAEAAAAAVALTGDAGLPLVQELVSGRALAVTAVVRSGDIIAKAARETLTSYPLLGGNSVRRRTIAATEPGVREALDLLLATEMSGLAEVEYQLGSDGVPRLMEIGPRAHGWVPLAVAAGVDIPAYAAAVALDIDVEPSTGYRVGVELVWPGGEAHRLRAALSRTAAVPFPLTRGAVVRGAWPPWRPGMRYDGIELRDLGPTLPRRLRGPFERSKLRR